MSVIVRFSRSDSAISRSLTKLSLCCNCVDRQMSKSYISPTCLSAVPQTLLPACAAGVKFRVCYGTRRVKCAKVDLRANLRRRACAPIGCSVAPALDSRLRGPFKLVGHHCELDSMRAPAYPATEDVDDRRLRFQHFLWMRRFTLVAFLLSRCCRPFVTGVES